jgi:NADPH:quinone reductase-like Zn-dependent oxidoreductase
MKAAVLDRYGPPDAVEIQDVPDPVPVDDQVLVRVRAASVNRADLDGIYPRWAFTRLFIGLRKPKNRRVGLDVAGVVEAVGPSVTRFRPGGEVFGDLSAFGMGAFAEYVCAPEKAFALMPAGMTFEEAAALPHSAILALQGLRLRDGRSIKRGDKVLIVGSSGNVGPFAVQIAKSMGAVVSAVDRGDKLDLVRSLGADRVFDYTTTDPTKTGERYDWILDVDAHHSILAWRRALSPNGVYVTLGGPASTMLTAGLLGMLISRAGKRWMGLLFWWKPFNPDDVERLKRLIAEGKVRPVIDRRFPLSEVVAALQHVDDGHARGKVVVTA